MGMRLHQLARTIGRTDLAVLVVGSVIGSGIFLVPGGVLAQCGGSLPLASAVWLLGGARSLMGALTYGELSAMNPGAGGLYLYLRDAFGKLPAFLYGWTIFLVICPGTVATLAVGSTARGNAPNGGACSPLTGRCQGRAVTAHSRR